VQFENPITDEIGDPVLSSNNGVGAYFRNPNSKTRPINECRCDVRVTGWVCDRVGGDRVDV
jgi:hypothetical protein